MQDQRDWKSVVIRHAGHEIACRVQDGDAAEAPVIFLPGILTTVDFWPIVLRDMPWTRRCAAVSLPGHAPSTPPPGFSTSDVTPELFSGIVQAAADAIFPDERVHVVGWSTGGFAALMAAAAMPDRVASVTCICGFVRGRWGTLFGLMQLLAGTLVTRPLFHLGMYELGRFRLTSKIIMWLISTGWPPRDDAVCVDAFELLYPALRQHNRSDLAKLFTGLRRVDATDRLSRINAPALLIGGDSDPVVPPNEAEHLHEQLPNSTLEILQPGAHLFYAEHRQHVLSLIRRHCERESPMSAGQ